MESLLAKRETFPSGHWLGVKVTRAYGQAGLHDGYSILVGTGYRHSGSWQPVPVPVFDRLDAELIACKLYDGLLAHAALDAERRDERVARRVAVA